MTQKESPADGTVRERAVALARAILATSAWREWQGAQAAFEKNPKVADLLARYRQLSEHWRDAKARGAGLAGKEAMELAELREEIQGHELVLRQQQAVNVLMSLLQEANKAISSLLGIDFATHAAPPRAGCCG